MPIEIKVLLLYGLVFIVHELIKKARNKWKPMQN